MVFVPLKLLMLVLFVAAIAGLVYLVARRRWGKALLLVAVAFALLVIGVISLRLAHSPRVHIVERNTYPSGIHDYVLQQQMAVQEQMAQQQKAARVHVEQQRRSVERMRREAKAMHERAMRQARDCQQHVQTAFVDRVNDGGQTAESDGSGEIVEMAPGRMSVQGPDWDEAYHSGWADRMHGTYRDLFPDAQTVYHRAYTGSWAYQGLLLTAMLALITLVYGFLKMASRDRHRSVALPVCQPRWRCG